MHPRGPQWRIRGMGQRAELMRRIALGAGLAVGAFGTLVAVELYLLSRREFLPADPGYRIEALVEPGLGGEAGADALRLAVLGDSTVAGVGSPTMEESLPVLIAQRVADATGRPVDVRGHGVSGARTETVLRYQLPLVDGADVIVLVIGANDATHATFWPAFRQQTDEMLATARATGAAVVLAGTPRFNRTQIIPEPLRTMVDRYSTLLRGEQRSATAELPDVAFVDLAAEASPRFVGVPQATSPDGFHPSPIGYGFWADALAPAVVEAMPAT